MGKLSLIFQDLSWRKEKGKTIHKIQSDSVGDLDLTMRMTHQVPDKQIKSKLSSEFVFGNFSCYILIYTKNEILKGSIKMGVSVPPSKCPQLSKAHSDFSSFAQANYAPLQVVSLKLTSAMDGILTI